MNCANIGGVDRAIRVLAGGACIVLALTFLNLSTGSMAGVVAAGVGAVLVVTGGLGFCPAYFPFGISTRRTRAS